MEKEMIDSGKGKLKGKIELEIFYPENECNSKLIIVVPGSGGKNYPGYAESYFSFAKVFAEMGYTVVNFCPRGYGPSDGKFSHKIGVEDTISVVNFMLSKNKGYITGLIGSSSGTGVALKTATLDKRVKSVAIWGTTPLIKDFYTPEKKEASYEKFFYSRGVKLNEEVFVSELCNSAELINDVEQPVLICGGTDDAYVDPKDQFDMLTKTRNIKSKLIILPKIKHRVYEKDGVKFTLYVELLDDWFSKTI